MLNIIYSYNESRVVTVLYILTFFVVLEYFDLLSYGQKDLVAMGSKTICFKFAFSPYWQAALKDVFSKKNKLLFPSPVIKNGLQTNKQLN